MGGTAPCKELPTNLKRKASAVDASPACADDSDEIENQTRTDDLKESSAEKILPDPTESSDEVTLTNRKRKRRCRGNRGRDSVNQRKKNVFNRDMKVFEEAERNQVCFDMLSLIEQMEAKSALTVSENLQWKGWDDSNSRAALDRDGVPVLYHIPKLLLESDVEKYTTSCLRAVGSSDTRLTFDEPENENVGSESSYVLNAGEISGRVDFALAVAPGTMDKSVSPSPSLLGDSEHLKAFVADTAFISERVNNLISFIDTPFYEGLERLQEIIGCYPDVQALAVDPLVMEGRSLAFNHKAPLHANAGDFEAGWRALVSLGSFTEGGYVRIPRLGLRVRFLPGDALVLRGAFLEFEVEAWSGGQKVCLEFFTRGDLWRHAEVGL